MDKDFDFVLSLDPGWHNLAVVKFYGITTLNEFRAEILEVLPVNINPKKFISGDKKYQEYRTNFISRMNERMIDVVDWIYKEMFLPFTDFFRRPSLLVIIEENIDLPSMCYFAPLLLSHFYDKFRQDFDLTFHTVLPKQVAKHAVEAYGRTSKLTRPQKKRWTMNMTGVNNPDIADAIFNAWYIRDRFYK